MKELSNFGGTNATWVVDAIDNFLEFECQQLNELGGDIEWTFRFFK
jgi:hypothetical protein